MKNWTTQAARKLYNIPRWGQSFFDINDAGKVIAKNPKPGTPSSIELVKIASQLRADGFDFPILIRFIDILHHRIQQLSRCFTQSMDQLKYRGGFTLVYPIKVNQQFSVVDAILNTPEQNVGLEAGSKTELLAVLSLMKKPSGIIVCNGYKDKDYIRLALISEKLGYRCYIVLEKYSELELLLEQAAELNIEPRIGIRIQLNSSGCGVWQNTGGDNSKFGLSASHVLSVVTSLKNQQKLGLLQLLHFHLGSQIPDIKFIQRATAESAQYLAQLHHLGCHIKCIDVGGGLGVDYEGSNSESNFSINYDFQQYADCIIAAFQKTCEQHDIPHPEVFTESGRAITAHHAVLITNVVEDESSLSHVSESTPTSDCPELVHLNTLINKVADTPLTLIFSQAETLLNQVHQAFTHGNRDLAQRAEAERLFRQILERIRQQNQIDVPTDPAFVDLINQKLAAKYFCNFSLFQSLPDVWGLRQIFPILPLQRLDQKPDCHGTLRDITCDSDGRIDNYVENDGIEHSLQLHALLPGELYLVGFFLVGAYQEILGDMHNLFGDTHSVDVRFTQSAYEITHQQRGDSVQSILNYVHFDPKIIVKNFEVKLKSAMLSPQQNELYIAELKTALSGYSYLKSTP